MLNIFSTDAYFLYILNLKTIAKMKLYNEPKCVVQYKPTHTYRSDHQCGQIVITVLTPTSLNSFLVKAISKAKWQVHSRHCGQIRIFNLLL